MEHLFKKYINWTGLCQFGLTKSNSQMASLNVSRVQSFFVGVLLSSCLSRIVRTGAYISGLCSPFTQVLLSLVNVYLSRAICLGTFYPVFSAKSGNEFAGKVVFPHFRSPFYETTSPSPFMQCFLWKVVMSSQEKCLFLILGPVCMWPLPAPLLSPLSLFLSGCDHCEKS